MRRVNDVEASAVVASSTWERMEAACRAHATAYEAFEAAKAELQEHPCELSRMLRDMAEVSLRRAEREYLAVQSRAA